MTEENERISAARDAVRGLLWESPGMWIKDVEDTFFPPSQLPFTRNDLSRALVTLMWEGAVEWDEDGLLWLNPQEGSVQEQGAACRLT